MPERTGRAPELLVLAPNWLGDVVMCAPLLDLLDRAVDAAGRRPRLHLAVRRPWLPLFRDDPRFASLLPVARHGRHGGPAGVVRLAGDVRTLAVDGALLGPPSFGAAAVARLAGVPVRVGWPGDGRRLLLSQAVPRAPRGQVHHADELLALGQALLEACGLQAAARTGCPVLPGLAAWPAADPGPGPGLWVFAPGTTYGEAKVWPVPRAAELLTEVVGKRGQRLVLLGDAGAAGFVAALRARTGLPWRSETPGGAGVIDLTGRTSLAEAVGWLKAARVFVGNDSGLMHLAGSSGTPTVGVFGSTNPAWTAPLGPRTAVVTADGYPCRPCYRRTCNQPRFCLEDVAGERVLAVADALLDQASEE